MGPFVALPKNAESDISSSFRVTRAPLTAARNRSFWVRIFARGFFESAGLLSGGMGDCLIMRFNAKADLECVWLSRSSEFAIETEQ